MPSGLFLKCQLIMNIIQHHEPIDLEALFKQAENATIGIDSRDWEVFVADADEIHSFLGSSDSENRVQAALASVVASDEDADIIGMSKRFLLIIKHNPDCERPLMMDEMSAVNGFVSGLPERSDILWGVVQDSTLGNSVEIILLCNISNY